MVHNSSCYKLLRRTEVIFYKKRVCFFKVYYKNVFFFQFLIPNTFFVRMTLTAFRNKSPEVIQNKILISEDSFYNEIIKHIQNVRLFMIFFRQRRSDGTCNGNIWN